MMIGVKQAVAAARDFVRGLLDDETLAGITLEEVELSEDECFWLVTFGFPAPTVQSGGLSSALEKDFNIFEVDADTGNVISMEVRAVA
jgi:predicted transcriptional regulator